MLLAVLAGVLALSPGARSAFLEIFRIRGATVVRVDELPEVEAQRLDLGRRVSREEAERLVGFRLVDVGAPDGIYVRDGTASLVYGQAQTPRLVLTQGRGGVWGGFVKKVGATGTRVENVSVDGSPALFVSGGEHFVMFIDEQGRVDDERTYLAGTVLLWNRGAAAAPARGRPDARRGGRAGRVRAVGNLRARCGVPESSPNRRRFA